MVNSLEQAGNPPRPVSNVPPGHGRKEARYAVQL